MDPSRFGTRLQTVVYVLLAVISGAALAVQTRALGVLYHAVGAPLAGALSNLTAIAGLIAIFAFRRRARQGLVQLRRAWRWRYYPLAMSGAGFVLVSALAGSQSGAALLSVAFAGGSIVGSVVIDAAGLAPGGRRPLTLLRGLSVAVALGAVGFASIGHPTAADLVHVALATLAGLGTAVQRSTNGHLKDIAGDPFAAALVGFCASTSLMLAVAGATRAPLVAPPLVPLLVSGGCGIVIVVCAAIAIRPLGVLRTGIASLSGQQSGGVVIDLLLPPAGRTVSGWTVLGAALSVVALRLANWTPAHKPHH